MSKRYGSYLGKAVMLKITISKTCNFTFIVHLKHQPCVDEIMLVRCVVLFFEILYSLSDVWYGEL